MAYPGGAAAAPPPASSAVTNKSDVDDVVTASAEPTVGGATIADGSGDEPAADMAAPAGVAVETGGGVAATTVAEGGAAVDEAEAEAAKGLTGLAALASAAGETGVTGAPVVETEMGDGTGERLSDGDIDAPEKTATAVSSTEIAESTGEAKASETLEENPRVDEKVGETVKMDGSGDGAAVEHSSTPSTSSATDANNVPTTEHSQREHSADAIDDVMDVNDGRADKSVVADEIPLSTGEDDEKRKQRQQAVDTTDAMDIDSAGNTEDGPTRAESPAATPLQEGSPSRSITPVAAEGETASAATAICDETEKTVGVNSEVSTADVPAQADVAVTGGRQATGEDETAVPVSGAAPVSSSVAIEDGGAILAAVAAAAAPTTTVGSSSCPGYTPESGPSSATTALEETDEKTAGSTVEAGGEGLETGDAGVDVAEVANDNNYSPDTVRAVVCSMVSKMVNAVEREGGAYPAPVLAAVEALINGVVAAANAQSGGGEEKDDISTMPQTSTPTNSSASGKPSAGDGVGVPSDGGSSASAAAARVAAAAAAAALLPLYKPDDISSKDSDDDDDSDGEDEDAAPRGLLIRREGSSCRPCTMCLSSWDKDQVFVCCRCLQPHHPACLDPPMSSKEVRSAVRRLTDECRLVCQRYADGRVVVHRSCQYRGTHCDIDVGNGVGQDFVGF